MCLSVRRARCRCVCRCACQSLSCCKFAVAWHLQRVSSLPTCMYVEVLAAFLLGVSAGILHSALAQEGVQVRMGRRVYGQLCRSIAVLNMLSRLCDCVCEREMWCFEDANWGSSVCMYVCIGRCFMHVWCILCVSYVPCMFLCMWGEVFLASCTHRCRQHAHQRSFLLPPFFRPVRLMNCMLMFN